MAGRRPPTGTRGRGNAAPGPRGSRGTAVVGPRRGRAHRGLEQLGQLGERQLGRAVVGAHQVRTRDEGRVGAGRQRREGRAARRRMRLRTTAEPARRVMANATRGAPTGRSGPVWSGTYTTDTGPRRARRPCWRRTTNVARSRMRRIRPTAGRDPCGGGPARWRGPPAWTCGAGSRASSHACGRWAGRCASLLPPRAAATAGPRARPAPGGGAIGSTGDARARSGSRVGGADCASTRARAGGAPQAG